MLDIEQATCECGKVDKDDECQYPCGADTHNDHHKVVQLTIF